MKVKLFLVICVVLPLVAYQAGQFVKEWNIILQTLEDLQSRLDREETRLHEQDTELDATRHSLTKAVTRLQEQDTELATTRRSLTEAVTSMHKQDAELAATRSSLTDVVISLRNQEKQINKQDNELVATRSSLNDAVSILQKQETELATTRRSLTQAVTRLQKQDTDLATTRSSLNVAVTRLINQENQINKQDTEIDDLKAIARRNKGSTYVRWGRTSCPGNGSELVYAGYAGGSHYTHSGAAVDYLCLPTDPSFAHYEDAVQLGAYVYGAGYALHEQISDKAFFPGNDQTIHLGKDVPCAVCRTVRSTVLMVPARTTCHDGWTLEYNGYLSAGDHGDSAASQYVCLDGQPEYLTGGAANYDGKLFYFVEGRCGSLRCPPYVDGHELTCAVCSI